MLDLSNMGNNQINTKMDELTQLFQPKNNLNVRQPPTVSHFNILLEK